jgi:hypothetical protein
VILGRVTARATSRGVVLGGVGSGGRRWRRRRARAEPEVRDDRWGPPISRAWRGAKAARLEASPREGGGKQAGRHQRVAHWADRAVKRLRPSGEGGEEGRLGKENGGGPRLG